MNKTTAILLAAGKSERFENDIPKPFILLNGKEIYRYSLAVFLKNTQINELVLVVPKTLVLSIKEKFSKEIFDKAIRIIPGGESRFESVQKALDVINDSVKNVIIHDAARPFITAKLIDNCLEKLVENTALSCAIKSTDTLVSVSENNLAESYPDRNNIMRIQTPQAFQTKLIKKAYSLAQKENKTNFTDDTSLIHYFKLAHVLLIPGTEENIKITFPKDLLLAKRISSSPH